MGKMVRGFLGREAVGCSPRRLRFAPYLLTGKPFVTSSVNQVLL